MVPMRHVLRRTASTSQKQHGIPQFNSLQHQLLLSKSKSHYSTLLQSSLTTNHCHNVPSPSLSSPHCQLMGRRYQSQNTPQDEDKTPPPTIDNITNYEGIDTKTRELMQLRHAGIEMNPLGLGFEILPGDTFVKTNTKTGQRKLMSVEKHYGYFWTLKDLRRTENKPILSNVGAIPSDIAKVFPALDDDDGGNSYLTTLFTGESVSLPHYITRNNRSMDASAQCTLVAIHYNEYGYQMLNSWIRPFQTLFPTDTDNNNNNNNNNRGNVINLSISEGTILRLLKPFIQRGYKKNTPTEELERTLLYFGPSIPSFKDVLRMHNTKTSYVYLLDGMGRVRFAGSGEARGEDVKRMMGVVRELMPDLGGRKNNRKSTSVGRGSQQRRIYDKNDRRNN